MPYTLENSLDQNLDIAGSLEHLDNLILANEAQGLGQIINSGQFTNITVGQSVVLSGLSGMTAESQGNYIKIESAINAANNGVFLIQSYINATSVVIDNSLAITENGLFDYSQHKPYSLEHDLNYIRTDRALIKGTAYDAAIPTYIRCQDQNTLIPANLANIAGNTTDAKSLILSRKFESVTISAASAFCIITDTGNLKHADAVDITGIPINDGIDAGYDAGTYVDIIDGYTGSGLSVLDGINIGNRIFGRTQAGSSISPNSIEIRFFSVHGSSLLSAVPYVWEASQPSIVDMYYGYRDCMSGMHEGSFRIQQINGIIANSELRKNVTDLQNTIGISDADTDLSSFLTGTTNYYSFSNLPDITPSVIDALNTLNAQIGSRNYTGSILTDGQTVSESLQDLSDYVNNVIPSDGYGLTPGAHASLRQLIHLSDNDGPFEEYISGAYKEVIGNPFPTNIVWYTDISKSEKILEKVIVRLSNRSPKNIFWSVYADGGEYVLHTAVDTIFYNTVFETARVRNLYQAGINALINNTSMALINNSGEVLLNE